MRLMRSQLTGSAVGDLLASLPPPPPERSLLVRVLIRIALFVLGEANFSDHGANRLGASALMQGLADGYFIAPSTVANYLATVSPGGAERRF